MTTFQRVIKYLAIALAVALIIGIVSGVLGLLGLFGALGDRTDGEMQIYDVSDAIRELELEIHAAHVTIRQGDTARVESNLKDLTVKEKNGRLIVRQPRRLFTREHGAVILTLPATVVPNEADITAGAGNVTVEALTVRDLSLVLGAGESTLCNLTVSDEAEIAGGAGTLTVQDSTLHGLELSMGVGKLNMQATLTGESEIACGVGEVNLTLTGGRETYRVEVTKGLGNATADGNAVKGETVIGSGVNTVEISGGVGALTVDFE
ncbi:MAG: DUF4097 domain-containing protein [Ruminococcaceae bacterium]|nr:DUF4097 domain-containing protein [Oscillospiraceae bacterium]